MVPVETITAERLARWSKRLSESHATPLLLLAVGHDHVSGQLVICTLEEPEISNSAIRGYLEATLRALPR